MKGSTHANRRRRYRGSRLRVLSDRSESGAIYMAVAVFSALSADLDGASILTGRLSKLSVQLRELAIWAGLLSLAVLGYLYFDSGRMYPAFAAIAGTLSLLGFVSKEGFIRNALVSVVGGIIIYFGWKIELGWLIGLGAFVAVVPWLAHRGMTHTVWAIAIWAWIGYGLEQQVGIEGIMLVAAAGYISHLVLDTLTPLGVKWLYPLINKSIKLP